MLSQIPDHRWNKAARPLQAGQCFTLLSRWAAAIALRKVLRSAERVQHVQQIRRLVEKEVPTRLKHRRNWSPGPDHAKQHRLALRWYDASHFRDLNGVRQIKVDDQR